MDEAPVLRDYQTSDRDAVFSFIREAYPADESAYLLKQWHWKFEANPFTPATGPDVCFIRVGDRIVGLSAGFRVRMWMGGIECAGEGRGMWIVHRDYRKQNLWVSLKSRRPDIAPVQFGWTLLPGYVGMRQNRPTDPLKPLVRVLDAGQLIGHYTNSGALATLGSAITTAARIASSPLRRARRMPVVRLTSFDDRVDRLWERARRADKAMIIREQHYLNWRYCRRPDATYVLYAVERGSDLDGFLVTRIVTLLGMRWGYLVDFLVPENDPDVLTSLIDAALDDFRVAEVAAASCYVTDRAARRVLFGRGFFMVPQRKPVRFMRWVWSKRTELAQFRDFERWYLTMGDADLEMLTP
jgi:hypothetical protein